MINTVQKLEKNAADDILTISAVSKKKYTIIEFIHKDNLRDMKQLESEWLRVISFIRTPNMIVDFSSARIIPSMALAVTIRMIGKLINSRLNVYFFCPDIQTKKALNTIGNNIPVYTDLFEILKDIKSLSASSKRWLSKHGRKKALKKIKSRFIKEKHPGKRRTDITSKRNFAAVIFLLLSAMFCTWRFSEKPPEPESSSVLKKILNNLPNTYADESTNKIIVMTGPQKVPFLRNNKIFWKAYKCLNKKCPGRKNGKCYIFAHILEKKKINNTEIYDETTPAECPLCKAEWLYSRDVERYWTAAALEKLNEIKE